MATRSPSLSQFASMAAAPPERGATLYGRDDEMASLRVALAAASSGHGRLVLLAGEAGLGKSSLIEALAAEADAASLVVLSGHCYDPDAAPYEPWLDLLRGYAADGDLPELPPGLANAEWLEALAGKDALFEQVAGFLRALAAARPVMLVLEDLHWSDQASLDLLRSVARRIRSWPLLVVGSFRDNELAPGQPLQRVLPLLVRENRPLRLDLRPLSEDDVRLMLGDRYRLSSEDEARLASHLQRYAEGNPFYLTEVLRTLEHERLLQPDRDGWVVGDLTAAPVPPLVRHLIDERLAQLDAEAQRLLRAAAVIGLMLPPDLWQVVSSADDETFAETVDAARRANLLAETPDRSSLRFSHALVREALYDSLALPRRRAWHRLVAEVLVERGGSVPDTIAHHFLQAGDQRAADWLIRAAHRAERRDAAWDAIARYEQAIPLLEQEGAADALAWAHTDLAESYRYIDPAKAAEHLRIADRVARGTSDRVLLLAICWLEIRLRGFLGQNVFEDLRKCFQGLEAMSVEEHAHFAATGRLNLPSRGQLALWTASHGRYGEAAAYAETVIGAIRDASSATAHNELGCAYQALGLAHAGVGRPEAARTAFAAAREHFQAIGSAFMTAMTLKWEWIEVAAAYATEDLGVCRRLIGHYTATMAGLISFAVFRGERPLLQLFGPALLDGRWNEARESALAYLDVPAWRVSALATLGEVERRQGRPVTAWTHVRAAFPEGPETEPGSLYFVDMLRLQRLAAELALDEGNPDLALAWIDAHDRWLAWSGRLLDRAVGSLLRARYCLARGEREAAAVLAQQALDLATEPRQPLALLATHTLIGTLATERGAFEEAERHLGQALALADACELPYERALIWLEQIRLQAALGGWDTTLPLRKQARALLYRLEAAPALARLDALERQSAEGALTVLPAGLSPRQVEVLRLAAQGLSYADIGDRLFISPRTVARHLQAIYSKLGVDSRAEAAAFAHGLV